MPSFDESKAYANQEETFFDDGREEELVKFITSKPELRGSPRAVLKGIDEYARTKKYLMNVGEDKGRIVVDIIRERKPKVMVELGGYCGYSTILFADAVDGQYFSLERSPKFAKNIKALVDFAGLKNVEIIVGPSNEGLQQLYDRGLKSIDMMFLDHYKPAYTTDLKLCESLGMINKGTILAADNVISPGNPPYLKYVRSSVKEKRMALTQETTDTENFPGRSAAQYGSIEKLDKVKGNPNIIYKSELVESWEPTGVKDGVELTKCLGVDEEA
ncbi:S-adenosyl-L-methionine-dependent methyltransferase [Mollisia scopiformis]|uniref:catechol O-methyltransferase n=1 Tax=Mollisia scopiformis TaxID=149040 RepID=A0A194XN07_MOLSC|nr:S-adenosyl-L-methionine-dependent methyltransferase [Mollisia scopiformis]KUJ21543.1 S-adenosyl-L-methionine-dependent methyltransferase [Mollisia scopiformis]